MSLHHLDPIRSKHFAEQLADAASNPSSSTLLYLLPPCLVILAVDAVFRMRNRQSQVSDVDQQSDHDEKIRRLGEQSNMILSNFKELDRTLKSEGARSRTLVRTLVKQRNFAHHRQRLAEYTTQQSVSSRSPNAHPSIPDSSKEAAKSVGAPFTNFCERLLLQNQIWKQQKEIKVLQNSLDSMKANGSTNAFTAFCDRLLLSNSIWKLQKEVNRLSEETEKLKRARVAAVTRAAKQMVQDVRKERLTEEFVKELIIEAQECRQAVATLRAEHEKEIQELTQEWRDDCRRLMKEVVRLKLAEDARMMQQTLSNDMESELLERLAVCEKKVKGDGTWSAEGISDALQKEDLDTLSDDTDLEEMSNMSTSTFVGSAGQCSPSVKSSFDDMSMEKPPAYTLRGSPLSPIRIPRRQSSSSSLRSSYSTKTPIRKTDPTQYAGFSFNPLFFGNASIARKEGADEIDSPVTSSFVLRSPPAHRRAGSLSAQSTPNLVEKQVPQQQKRVQWRF